MKRKGYKGEQSKLVMGTPDVSEPGEDWSMYMSIDARPGSCPMQLLTTRDSQTQETLSSVSRTAFGANNIALPLSLNSRRSEANRRH